MPTVIGINQVPPNAPRPNMWDYWGQMSGTTSRALTDAFLVALTAGAYQRTPNPMYGQPTPPPTLNPDVALSQATPPMNPLAPPQNPQTVLRQQTTPPPPPIFPNKPMLSPRDIEVAQAMQKIRESQQALNPSSPENRLKRAQADFWSQHGSQFRPPQTPQDIDGGNGAGSSIIPQSVISPLLKDLFEKSHRGDTKSADMIRRLAVERQDPEAIAILESWGEL